MKMFVLVAITWLFVPGIRAQHTLQVEIRDSVAKRPLAGATVVIRPINKTQIADSLGKAKFINLQPANYTIHVSHVGYGEEVVPVLLPLSNEQPVVIWLEESEEDEDEVIVVATRSSRSIKDIPTRVETISGEELDEKSNMKPGEIRMLLNESTGIQTQQTSATSYNYSLRIQGLDGRYTQLLKDGVPLYAGFSSGLSLMQIAPLDLRQAEVIKGSSSTLYGGGAIAGLVNLVSKTPSENRELTFLANGTSAKGLDLSGFYSQRFNKIGITAFGSRNSGSPYDPADIGLTAIPKFERYTINPRMFLYGQKTNANFGVGYIAEKRTGGSMEYIKHDVPGYYEQNNTKRITSQAEIVHEFNEQTRLQFKSNYSNFKRLIEVPDYTFEGRQQSSYSELNFQVSNEKMSWIAGANFLTDDFKEVEHNTSNLRDYHYKTYGLFVQNTWSPNSRFSVETGLRSDYVKQYGLEVLPRVSLLYKISSKLTARLGGGLGYRTPTVFNEEAEKLQYQNILPIDESIARNEKSAGGNLDLNFRTHMGEVGFTLNQLFFYTYLNRPLILTPAGNGDYEFLNAPGHIDTRGLETNIRLSYKDFKLFFGYTYADVNTHFNGVKNWFPLTARHRLNNVLMYEKEENLKIGAEAYFFSPQKLSDGTVGRSYWICGLMAEKFWERFSIFINFENLFDTRQTKFDTIFTGSIDDPTFKDIYAPLDGFVMNGGIKLRL